MCTTHILYMQTPSTPTRMAPPLPNPPVFERVVGRPRAEAHRAQLAKNVFREPKIMPQLQDQEEREVDSCPEQRRDDRAHHSEQCARGPVQNVRPREGWRAVAYAAQAWAGHAQLENGGLSARAFEDKLHLPLSCFAPANGTVRQQNEGKGR